MISWPGGKERGDEPPEGKGKGEVSKTTDPLLSPNWMPFPPLTSQGLGESAQGDSTETVGDPQEGKSRRQKPE